MENLSKPILIPTDFTVVAQYAVEAAARFARIVNAEIVLVHVAKKSSDIVDATAKVSVEAANFTKEYGVKVSGIVREGSIFITIGATVEEIGAGIVFLGTHGVKGMQKVTGSWCLKVTTTSNVPVVVVQGHSKDIQRVVFPVDYKKENREKIGWLNYVAHLFDPNVYIFRDKVYKDKKLEQNLRTNLVFTQKFLNSKKIFYDVVVAEGKESFVKETLNYAERVNADLIIITTTKDISFANYLFGVKEETVIDNAANIPVMCINPKKSKVSGGFSAMGGA
ncbi:MAG: universal stress protein [Bacteroidales bacterium]|jgi:nucleotide-binding universal stress UspA family protein|nr:universal stress protein [Bacteroidales bacterium]